MNLLVKKRYVILPGCIMNSIFTMLLIDRKVMYFILSFRETLFAKNINLKKSSFSKNTKCHFSENLNCDNHSIGSDEKIDSQPWAGHWVD